MQGLFERLKEPSTYAGLAVLAAIFLPGTEDQWADVFTTGAAFVAALAVILRERGN